MQTVRGLRSAGSRTVHTDAHLVREPFTSSLQTIRHARVYEAVEGNILRKHVEKMPVVLIYMYCSLQNLFFEIETVDFNDLLVMFDPLLKCFSEFGGLNTSEYLVAGQEIE